jgi:hypothetical protein
MGVAASDRCCKWAENGVRKKDYARRWLRPMVRWDKYGVS